MNSKTSAKTRVPLAAARRLRRRIWQRLLDSPYGPNLDRLASELLSLLTLDAGSRRARSAIVAQPDLILYDRERDADCRRVRQLLSELELEHLVVPCPDAGDLRRAAPEGELTCDVEPPVLVEHSGPQVFEGADAILDALRRRFTTGPTPPPLRQRIRSALAHFGAPLRPPRSARRSELRPDVPLVLWGNEGDADTRRVRERLHDLTLPYRCRPVPEGGRNIERMERATGHRQVPVLQDPNAPQTQHELGAYAGVEPVLAYLERRFGRGAKVDVSSVASFPASDPPSYWPN